MDSTVLLVVCYNDITMSVRVGMEFTVSDLKRRLVENWPNISPSLMELSFVRDSRRVLIETDFDLQSLVCYSCAKGESIVTILLSLKGDMVPVSSRDLVPISSTCSGICNDEGSSYSAVSNVHILTGIGQRFQGGAKEFRIQLLRHCVHNGFKITLLKNEPSRVTAECFLKTETGCKWRVHASTKFKMPNFFVIKKFEGVHTCGAGFKDVNHPTMTSQLVKSVVIDMVRDNSSMKPKDIIDHFRREFGVKLNYYFAYTGRQLAMTDIHGDEELSYHQLEWYVGKLVETNPGSHIVLEKNVETNKFERLFVAFSACTSGFNFCRAMLFVDGTFLKGKYKGCLLSASGKNGNEGFFTLAFAVVLSENVANWNWFMENLKLVISGHRRYVFISDRHPGLISSIPRVFPDSFHAYCYYHLKKNFEGAIPKRHPQRSYVVGLFSRLAYAATHSEFQQVMVDLKEAGVSQALSFLADLPVEHWSNAYFQGMNYGEMCSNIAESFNSWILLQRDLPITSLVDKIRIKIMNMMSDRREMSSKWTSILCPKKEKLLSSRIKDGMSWLVVRSSEFVFEVHSTTIKCVDLGRRHCSCNMWRIEGFPCAHAIRCILGAGKDVYSYCDMTFHSSVYRDCYSRAIEPVPNEDLPSEIGEYAVILPPECKRRPGRPQKQRFLSYSERSKRKIRCTRCNTYGNHNRKTCSAVI